MSLKSKEEVWTRDTNLFLRHTWYFKLWDWMITKWVKTEKKNTPRVSSGSLQCLKFFSFYQSSMQGDAQIILSPFSSSTKDWVTLNRGPSISSFTLTLSQPQGWMTNVTSISFPYHLWSSYEPHFLYTTYHNLHLLYLYTFLFTISLLYH